ncbi:hypothetical protein GCM10010269_53630 [Streptomyces humidus]|uniref:Uncharacterized protein n=1 Tax=Streptomyces humidus TaxID=52259 RepID=A0A918FZI6_9ACTN|nr:hypothetical protein [Streptomyces humidus]GGS07851.1 hypothetical protein GCM10010269_53630 [Streptomyces humidus]
MITPPWEQRAKHLEFLQSTIARLSTNSFLIKGWTMTLTGALGAVVTQLPKRSVATAALLLTMGFWLLDSYYLRQERMFRSLYEKAAEDPSGIPLFTLDADRYSEPVGCLAVFLSSTMLLFYGSLLLLDVTGLVVLA